MSATGDPTGADLREAGVHGLRWTAMARLAVEAVLLVSMVVLARLISPAEFGYFAVAIIVQELALVITAEGVGTALVQRRTVDREHLQAGLWLGLVVGLVLGLLTLVAASLIVVPIFGARTAELVRLATPLFLISAAGDGADGAPAPAARVPPVEHDRRRHLGRARRRLAGAGHRRAAGRGARPGRDRRRRDDDGDGLDLRARADAAAAAQAARELMSYGLPASVASMSWVGFRNCDYAIVSARLGALQAGYYFRAYMLAVEYVKKISIVMGQVGLPVLARAGEEMAALRGQMVRMLAILTFPMLAVLTITAPELVPWLFGAEWAPAVLPMQILAAGGASTIVIDAVGVALMASGRPRALLGFGVAHFVTYALAVLVASRFGLAGVAAAASIVHTAFLGVAYSIMLSGTDQPPLRTMWSEIGPALGACAGLVAVAVPVALGLSAAGAPTLVQIALVTLAALGAYAAALRLWFPSSWADVVAVARRVVPSLPGRIRLRRPLEVS